MDVAHPSHKTAQFLQQPAHIGIRVRQEVGERDLFRLDAVKMAQDDLQGTLVELNLTLDQEKVSLLEQAEQVLACVPEARRNAAGAVAQLDLQIEVALAVCS